MLPQKVRLRGKQYRIISTRYPPIDFFEQHIPASMVDALWALEARTNPRMLQETGDINLVSFDDRVSGPGASIVMASFTHIGFPSRFSDGSYGVYYAARNLNTAIYETAHHRTLMARGASLSACEFSMRAWVGEPRKSYYDVRGPQYSELHDKAPRPGDHPIARAFGKRLKMDRAWGIVYNSVRFEGGQCLAALRPPAVTLPIQAAYLNYVWDGDCITQVYEKSEPIVKFD